MKLAFRFGYFRYAEDRDFEENLAFIGENIDLIDEITLFVEFSHHGYWPIEWQKKSADLLKRRMRAYRGAGVKSVGINVLATIGHLDENFDILPVPPMQTMVGDDGRVSRSCLCINSEEYLSYIAERYRLLARANPEFIWIDDDFRIPRHGVANPCFCPKCVADFSASFGRKFDRESLVKAIGEEEEVKTAFDAFRMGKFTALAEVIERAVHGVNPAVKLGFMTSPEWKETIWMEKFKAVMGRPGGGFYHDDRPNDVIRKAFDVGRQIALYPPEVTDIQYEFENFPYQEFAKSQTLIKTESVLSFLYGCNGVLYNAMFKYHYPRLMRTLRACAGQWKTLVKYAEHGVNGGIFGNQHACLCFGELGIPLASSFETCGAAVLCGREEVAALGDEQLLALFKKGLLLDGEAFREIDRRGFGRYCGVFAENGYTNGVREKHTDHPFNGGSGGYVRDIFMSFWSEENKAYTYRLAEGAEALSELETVLGESRGVSAAVYENELGGRVCVTGYFFPEYFKCREKQCQLMNVFDFLCRGLPAKARGDGRVHVAVRESADCAVIGVVNCGIDVAEKVIVETGKKYASFKMIEADGSLSPAEVSFGKHGAEIIVKNVNPWDYRLILCEKQ